MPTAASATATAAAPGRAPSRRAPCASSSSMVAPAVNSARAGATGPRAWTADIVSSPRTGTFGQLLVSAAAKGTPAGTPPVEATSSPSATIHMVSAPVRTRGAQ